MAKNIYITGAKELAQALAQLPDNIEKNIMRGALRAGAKVIADEAKELVPTRTNKLKENIRLSTSAKKREVSASVKAGGKEDVFYYKFVEFGTQPHLIRAKEKAYLKFIAKDGTAVKTKQVSHTGAIEKPFMRPALDKKNAEAIVKAGDYIRKRLGKEGITPPDRLTIVEE